MRDKNRNQYTAAAGRCRRDEPLVETWRAGNRDAGIRTGRGSKNVERDSRAFVVSAISTVIIRTAKQMAVAGAFLESVRRCCETYVRCIRQLREVMAGGR